MIFQWINGLEFIRKFVQNFVENNLPAAEYFTTMTVAFFME